MSEHNQHRGNQQQRTQLNPSAAPSVPRQQCNAAASSQVLVGSPQHQADNPFPRQQRNNPMQISPENVGPQHTPQNQLQGSPVFQGYRVQMPPDLVCPPDLQSRDHYPQLGMHGNQPIRANVTPYHKPIWMNWPPKHLVVNQRRIQGEFTKLNQFRSFCSPRRTIHSTGDTTIQILKQQQQQIPKIKSSTGVDLLLIILYEENVHKSFPKMCSQNANCFCKSGRIL